MAGPFGATSTTDDVLAGFYVSGDGRANPTAADQDAALGLPGVDRLGQRLGKVRIIHWAIAVGSDIDDLMSKMA